MIVNFNHGEIWLANLNPTKGTEPCKTRPVLILQNQILLDWIGSEINLWIRDKFISGLDGIFF